MSREEIVDSHPEFEDDPSIDDEDYLLRRVPCHPDFVIEDKNYNCFKPSSAAFKDPKDSSPMSVSIEKDLELYGLTYDDVVYVESSTFPEFFLVKFKAKVPRSLTPSLIVVRQSLEDNPAHGIVVGKKTKSASRALQRACEWVIGPELGHTID